MAAKMGAGAVEIDARTELRPAELTDTGVRQFRKMLDDLNLRISSIRFQTRRGYDVVDDLDRRVEATKQTLRMAFRLGTDVVVNQIGQVPSDPESAAWDQLRTVLDDINRYGAHIGAFLTPETGTEDGADLLRLLDANEESFTPVAFNPGNLIINRFSAGEALRVLGDRVRLICARDGVQDLAAGRGIEVPLGQGLADFHDILGYMENYHYQGWVVVQRSGAADPIAEIADAVGYLANM
ncbi:sugar phosphate isomerase/epimerase family protein [Rosistilla oblonga]|uniref:sugar phosphate isomerase/epimerase family protein n=1 Tax=Rosistilla oblonga TaxID=2527990 RepID=UPI003A97543B